MNDKRIPEFAIVGHPNEGKSSVVSTLAEDDSVRVTPTPGETIECQTFPVIIDGKELIRFIDTPGFQNPKATLQWMREYTGPDEMIVRAFRDAHLENPDFRDDCELLKPITQGAGIIYVVDGSRPLRKVDRAEMEILRMTGCPRMAIINSKEAEQSYLEQWKSEFRKHFNAVRRFNAHQATYAERIALLENLKSIDQDWQPALETVIKAFKDDWEARNLVTADIICRMLTDCLTHSVSRNLSRNASEEKVRREVALKYSQDIEKKERSAHTRIRGLFKHNIFNYELPAQSILHEDLFDKKTWQVLGLTRKQLIITAGVSGAAVGAAIDVAAAGVTFGVFSAIAGAVGAGWMALGGDKQLARTKVAGLPLGGHQIKTGPHEQIQFLYILLDRALIFYAHIINWAHGRRDFDNTSKDKTVPGKAGLTYEWDESSRKICARFFNALRSGDDEEQETARDGLKAMLQKELFTLSTTVKRYG